MSETKPVVWYGDDRKANTFFFRSPFHSWKFLINTGLVALMSLALAGILWRYWDKLNEKTSIWIVLFVFFPQNIVYPFWRAFKRHRKINELYAAGYVTEQAAGSPLDEVLQVTDDAMNEGLLNTMFVFGIFLLAFVMWKLR